MSAALFEQKPGGMAARGWEPLRLGEIPIEEGELSPPNALEDIEPNEEHFHEATGNEGAPSTARTAAPPWRSGRGNLGLWCSTKRSLAAKWIDAGALPDSALWIEAHELSEHVLDTWPQGIGTATATTMKTIGRLRGRPQAVAAGVFPLHPDDAQGREADQGRPRAPDHPFCERVTLQPAARLMACLALDPHRPACRMTKAMHLLEGADATQAEIA
jgi:hypothetical protein